MRFALVLAVALALGGVAFDATPEAAACSSDPAFVCAAIWKVDCMEDAKPTSVLRQCWGLP